MSSVKKSVSFGETSLAIYEEELGVRDGFRWSPDSTAIAYWQFDESGVRRQTMLDHVSGLYPKAIRFGYPKVGQKNAACRVGVVEIADARTTEPQMASTCSGARPNILACSFLSLA